MGTSYKATMSRLNLIASLSHVDALFRKCYAEAEATDCYEMVHKLI